MRLSARAFAWEFSQRHRWGLIAIAGYLLGLTTIRLLILHPGQFVDEIGPERYAAIVVVPLTSAVLYLLAMFSFGFVGDLVARQSMYPARMFTLPVTTAALAGWPMLYGTVTMAGLWLATTRLVFWPTGVVVPLVWPALCAAVFLAWTQVLTWMPYPVRGMRVVVAVLLLVSIDGIAVVAINAEPPEALMVAVLAPQLPLAYFIARIAVARARRGEVPDWRGTFARLGQIADVRPHRRGPFPSPVRAQVWCEWRQHGWSLPTWVGILLPFELALLFVGGDSPAFVLITLVGVLFTPAVMAAFVAATVGKASPLASDAYGMAPFVATRPLTSAELIAAKLRVTIRSTVAAWLLVLVAVPLALSLSETWPIVIDRARQVREVIGTPRIVAIALLGFSGLVAATWKRLVLTMYIGLSGRAWLIRTNMGLTLAFLVAIVPLAQWVSANTDIQMAIWDAVLWMPAVLVVVKMSAAAWIATRLHRARLLSERALVTGAASWLLAVFALYALLVWLVATPHIPRYVLVLVAILAIPLARLSVAPLAVAWNRHR